MPFCSSFKKYETILLEIQHDLFSKIYMIPKCCQFYEAIVGGQLNYLCICCKACSLWYECLSLSLKARYLFHELSVWFNDYLISFNLNVRKFIKYKNKNILCSSHSFIQCTLISSYKCSWNNGLLWTFSVVLYESY